MKIRLAFACLPAMLVAGWLAVPASAQDKSKAPPPGTTKTILDNEKVLVTENTFKPGQGGAVRERKPRVVRALSDGTMERIYPDGKTEKVEWKVGQVRYLPKETFGNRNVGKSDVVLFIVEPK
jgi:hypothetical protein